MFYASDRRVNWVRIILVVMVVMVVVGFCVKKLLG